MLYEDSPTPIRQYDPETGVFLNEEMERSRQGEEEQLLSEAQYFRELIKAPGWKIMEAWLKEVSTQYKEALIATTELDKIVRLQEAAKCYQSLLNYPHLRILQAHRLQEQRTLLVEDQLVNP